MRGVLLFFAAATVAAGALRPSAGCAQQASDAQGDAQLEEEAVETAKPAPPAQGVPEHLLPEGEGFMTSAKVKELLQKLWLVEFRVTDLLSEVKPERWSLDADARQSFGETLATLRRQLESLGAWRAQFDARPDSVYLGFEMYTAVSAVLPRLDAVAESVARHENASLGVQFSQAGNQLYDLQQALQPYLAFLLRNQDQVLASLQSNLAACHSELSFAMRGNSQPVKPMRNIRPDFKGRRVPRTPQAPAGQPAPQ
jgi:hypothetical protein